MLVTIKTYIYKVIVVSGLISLALTCLYGAKIYKWDSKKGDTTYSDLPPHQEENYEILEMKESGNSSKTQKLINKTKLYRNSVEKKLQDYKAVKEHHSSEDVSPIIQKLKALPAEELSPQGSNLKKQKNCEIAQSNLDNLNNSDIILDKNNKISKLSKFKHRQQIKNAEKQVSRFC